MFAISLGYNRAIVSPRRVPYEKPSDWSAYDYQQVQRHRGLRFRDPRVIACSAFVLKQSALPQLEESMNLNKRYL